MMEGFATILFILIAGMLIAVALRKLTVMGALVGGVTGFFVYAGTGYTGIVMMASFFVMATLATSWKKNVKAALYPDEIAGGPRNAGQVLANAGVAAAAGLLGFVFPDHRSLFSLMTAAAFASAASDTISSEIGNIYGRKFYNILTWKSDKRGADGVISLPGTFAGVAAAIIIATIYSTGFGWSPDFFWIVLAGTIGNLFDSVLGATLERKRYIGNDTVNILNTLVAALVVLFT